MNPETFFDKFGLLADTPNGVQKLRELILQLAVQGKLVRQDENDEPAAVLLEKIKAEKERLVKEGTIKKAKPLPEIQNNEILFKLPLGWKWAKLGDYTFITMGQSPESKYYNKEKVGLPFYQGKTEFGKLYPTPSKWCEVPKKIAEQNDILISVRAPVGPTNICQEVSCIGRGLTSLRNLSGSNHFHLLYSLRAFERQISEMGVGSTFTAISKAHLDNILIPVPPLDEQRRIVAKVDQLMALCDKLEARQQKKQEARLRLNSAALDKLLTAHEPAEFTNHWQRVCDNFDLIYDNPETVGELRKAILQLAVQGKLVRQDENDEPAAVLFEKIRAKKERLVKEGKIRKSKPLSLLMENDIPFKLPSSWIWIPLGEGVDYNGAQKISPNEIPDDAWLLDLENIEKDTSRIIQRIMFKDKKSKSTKSKFEKGDVLYGKLRPYLNKVVVADDGGYCTTEIIPLRGYHGIFPKYLMYALKRPDFLEYVNSKTYGVKMPRLGTEDGRSAPFPLPPLEEQRRIVAKVDQLMALCDELESKLNQSHTDGAKLMEAVVAELVGA